MTWGRFLSRFDLNTSVLNSIPTRLTTMAIKKLLGIQNGIDESDHMLVVCIPSAYLDSKGNPQNGILVPIAAFDQTETDIPEKFMEYLYADKSGGRIEEWVYGLTPEYSYGLVSEGWRIFKVVRTLVMGNPHGAYVCTVDSRSPAEFVQVPVLVPGDEFYNKLASGEFDKE